MTVEELNFSIIFLLLLILDRFFNPFDCENQSLILEFLPAAMTPDTLIISYAKFYALQLVDDLFVEGLKSLLLSNIRTASNFLWKCFSIVIFCTRTNVLSGKFASFSLGPD